MMITDLSSPWWQMEFIVLDLEGTGAQHKEKEGIVEIAAIQILDRQITNNYYYQLINPEIDIPPMISRIHGLKNKDLEDKPIFELIKMPLYRYINNKILIGHNVQVDYRLLRIKMPEYQPAMIFDTKKISKHFWKDQQKHGLDDLMERFKIEDKLTNLPTKRTRHSAFYDAFATALIFLKMLDSKFNDLTTLKEVADIARIDTYPNNNQSTLF